MAVSLHVSRNAGPDVSFPEPVAGHGVAGSNRNPLFGHARFAQTLVEACALLLVRRARQGERDWRKPAA